MNNNTPFPDLALSFSKFKLIDAIAANPNKSLFASICADQVYEKPNEVIKMIREQVADNEPLCREMFGNEVINQVKLLA